MPDYTSRDIALHIPLTADASCRRIVFFDIGPGLYEIEIRCKESLDPLHIELDDRRVIVSRRSVDKKAATSQRNVCVRNEGLGIYCRQGELSAPPHVQRAAIDVKKLFLGGDSTVCDHKQVPWCAWGQILPCLFGPGIAIDNRADHGQSATSFVMKGHLADMLQDMRCGDYALFQFGHNDQKLSAGGPLNYRRSLMTCVRETKMRGGIPIVVTPVQRGYYERSGRIKDTLGEYPSVARAVAADLGVGCVDLTARSTQYLTDIGRRASKSIFVHAGPGEWQKYPDGIRSRSHNTMRGALEVAKCVAIELIQISSPLAEYLEDIPLMEMNPDRWPL